jgi:hypothetical protein
MSDEIKTARPPYLGIIFLACATVWLVAWSANVAESTSDSWFFTRSLLVGLCVIFWAEWTVHGIVPALVVAGFFLWSGITGPYRSTDFPEQDQLAVLAAVLNVGLLLLFWMQVNRLSHRRIFLAIVLLSAWIISSFIWITTLGHNQQADIYGRPQKLDVETLSKTLMALLLTGGLLGTWFGARALRNSGGPTRRLWIFLAGAAVILAPLAGYLPAELCAPVRFDRLFRADRYLDRLQGSQSTDSFPTSTLSWLVMTLMVIGFWRTLARGHRQWKQNLMPTAWFISLWVLFWLLCGFPAGPECERHGILLFCMMRVLLPVFAIADLMLLFSEQLTLPVPPEGPSDVPHVPHP